MSDGYFASSYMFPANGASLPDVLDQPSGNSAYFVPHLESSDGSLIPVLGRTGIARSISPVACFGPLDGPDGYLGMLSFVAAARFPSATRSSRGGSGEAGQTRPPISKNLDKEASDKSSKPKSAIEERGRLSASRESHNQVEKKYRDRLNDQFKRLQATLAVSSEPDPEARDDDSQRPLSKSAVLGLARHRLLFLEKEKSKLSNEVERLTGLLQRIG